MKLLLVEDDTKIAQLVVSGMEHYGFSVHHVADGEAGYESALSSNYDAAIIDLMLPKIDGIALIKKLRENRVNTPVLILSAKREVNDRVNGLTIGADDYLTKPFALAELYARVQALIRRSKGDSTPTILSIGDLTLDLLNRRVTRCDKEIELQPLEFDLLKCLVENSPNVVSKKTLIERVWKYNFDPETNIVEARVCMLREKLEQDNLPRLVFTIRGLGYAVKQ